MRLQKLLPRQRMPLQMLLRMQPPKQSMRLLMPLPMPLARLRKPPTRLLRRPPSRRQLMRRTRLPK